MTGGTEDRDMLAAEYVLGSLERHEARAIEAMAEGDPELAAAITEWQDRLAPLARLVPPSQAPKTVWDRLENAIAPVVLSMPAAKPRPAARAWSSVGFWRGTTAGALALAAAIAGVAVMHNPAEAPFRPIYLADLAPTGAPAESAPHGAAAETSPRVATGSGAVASKAAVESPQRGLQSFAQSAGDVSNSTTQRFQPAAEAPAQPAPSASGSTLQPAPEPTAQPAGSAAAHFMVASMPDGSIMVKPMGSVTVAAGRDLELWALPPGAPHAMPLGVLPTTGLRVAMAEIVQPSTKLMVSLEPQGGSPTGQPTGPVLYSGALTRVE